MFAFPPRRILVPVDLSAASTLAFRAARLLAAHFKARVEVVYCEASPPPEIGVFGSTASMLPARARVEASLRRRYPQADARHVLRGEPSWTLPKLIARRRPDLIVMGTHGRRGLERAILGSVTESMLRHNPVPVLSLRRPFKRPRHVLAPVREGDDSLAGLLAAGLMAQAFKARLDVLHVSPQAGRGAESETLLRGRLLGLPKDVLQAVKPRLQMRVGNPIEEILRASRKSDLVVLVARRKSLLGDLVLGTTAERVSRYAPVPVLAVPGGAKRRGPVLI
ncbi:MAG: universal stress protein [Elusimicrobia bacterium]|nr:universal stress protein [Elusimicrobiota bacterium]